MTLDRLVNLYAHVSKHSQYQILAAPLRELISTSALKIRSRYENERMRFILDNVPFKGASLADIGGNTGFFTIELIARGARSAVYFEGNHEHREFFEEALNVLGWTDRITVTPNYLQFDEDIEKIDVDICLLLNVMHHVGDDYGASVNSLNSAKSSITQSLISLSGHARILVFQLGFNWKGDVRHPLFTNGTKQEMIDFIQSRTEGYWKIRRIGIAERCPPGIIYRQANLGNIARNDALGEFLNRPLFIMESLKS